MRAFSGSGTLFSNLLILATTVLAQSYVAQENRATPQMSSQQAVETAFPAVAMVLAAAAPQKYADTIGTALVVREDGVLLTAYHLVRDAHALQVRLKSGETFDQVQLLGVDTRRDVAAIRITGGRLAVLPVASAANVKPGEPVVTISHPQALPWSASDGVVAAYRLADEIPGAGSGYRLIQFTAPASPGSSGGVLVDARGRALGLIVGSLGGGQNLNFAIPVESVLGLADAAPAKSFASGSALALPRATSSPAVTASVSQPSAAPIPAAAGQSDPVANSTDREFILRNFKTMSIDASKANFFGEEQMKAALARNPGFAPLNIRIVDDLGAADAVLVISYTFAWDYPFELKHTNTSTMLLAGKGSGAFSGPAGAASVAKQFVNAVKPWRESSTKAK